VSAADHAALALATASVIIAVAVDSVVVRVLLVVWWLGVSAYWIFTESRGGEV
jgi:uncharacterized membrane protein YbaN (DUF454 family)